MNIMDTVRLSIITVTYNSEKYLRTTIESVLAQIDYLYEYWIIDGGSKDSTLFIIKSYLSVFQGKLHFISEKDKGIYDAMNKGIRLSTGNVIGIINSDDYYNAGAFKTVVSQFSNDSIGLLYSDVNRIDLNGNITKVIEGNETDLKYGMSFNHPTCFVSKETYDNVGLFDLQLKIAADYDLALRIVKKGIKRKKSAIILASYREGGISSSDPRGRKETYIIQRNFFGLFWALYLYVKNEIHYMIYKVNF